MNRAEDDIFEQSKNETVVKVMKINKLEFLMM